MESRMEKYNEINIEKFQRSKKNANLYKEVYGNYGDFEDLPIPENTNEIDIENLKSLVETKNYKKNEYVDSQENNLEEDFDLPKENKVYDINALLEKAKEENAKIKKETPINRNIPNYLANLESDKNTKDIILKYDGDNDDDMPIVKEVKYSTTEIDLENNVVNTSTLSLDILSDLKPTGNTLVSEPLKEEIERVEQEKEFFDDNKIKFLKEDFDDYEEKEEDEDEFFEDDNEHIFLKILLIIIGLASVFTATFFIIKEYTNVF